MTTQLTIGPLLFHWPAEKKRDFYFRIADEAPVEEVYLGEVICSKRTPFFEQHYSEVAERLMAGGKKVIFSSFAEIMIPRERKMTEGLCEFEDFEVEANDAAALYHLRGKPHRIGQYFNVYNEDVIQHLASNGATHFTLPAELSVEYLSVLGQKAEKIGVSLEAQVFGRVGLALSARCYHARAHGRVKDNCQFVCEEDPDGMILKTLDDKDFLCINGVQTLSYTYLNLVHELHEMVDMGVKSFRLSPHMHDMNQVANLFKNVLDKKIDASEAEAALKILIPDVPFSNGFYHKTLGYSWHKNAQAHINS